MKRLIDNELDSWKDSPFRVPLIVRGARQVGKSFSIESFGRRCFESVVTVNFELQPNLKTSFDELHPDQILPKLELLLNESISPGKTLLFLDEIQECPNALKSLRYFKEKKPELHVVSAGSLLEFSLNDENFSFPVGRVEFWYMKPLSFLEFLLAIGEKRLVDYLKNVSVKEGVDLAIHEKVLGLVKHYCLIGGMPESIDRYLTSSSFIESKHLQQSLLTTYENDFSKYATQAKHKYLQTLFKRIPELIGHHVKFSKIDPTVTNPAREFKQAYEQLQHAGILQSIQATSANGIPLRAEVNKKKFKPLFLDTGLYQCVMNIQAAEILEQDLIPIHRGALAEQFVGQELAVLATCRERKELYFWQREKVSSSAEVDYVESVNGCIIPIEVKGGKSGRLKSLQQFMKEKQSAIGVCISESPLLLKGNILHVPFYLIHQLPRLIKNFLK